MCRGRGRHSLADSIDEPFTHNPFLAVAHLRPQACQHAGGGRIQRPADRAAECQPRAVAGVDHDAGSVQRIFNDKPRLDIQRNVDDATSFHAKTVERVVLLARSVAARSR